MRNLQPGDRVKLTGAFLKNTGQTRGGEGLSAWIVVACPCCMCAAGEFVAVNEPTDDGQRHFLSANLYRVGTRVVGNAL